VATLCIGKNLLQVKIWILLLFDDLYIIYTIQPSVVAITCKQCQIQHKEMSNKCQIQHMDVNYKWKQIDQCGFD